MTGAAVGMMMSHHDHDDRSERPSSPPPVSASASASVQSSPAQNAPDDDGDDLDTGVTPPTDERTNITPKMEATLSSVFDLMVDLAVLAALGAGAFFLIRKLRRDKPHRDWQEEDRSDDRPETSDEYGAAVKDRMMSEWGCPKGLRLGSNMTIPASSFLSDPDATVKIHAEPAAFDHSNGTVSIMGIGHRRSEPRCFDLYPDMSENEFMRVEVATDTHQAAPSDVLPDAAVHASGRIVSARFFSWIDKITPTSAEEWNEWIGDEHGMIGMPSFTTRDNVEWGRVIPGNTRISPDQAIDKEQVISASDDSVIRREVSEVLYARNTGFSVGYPEQEYLLLRVVADQKEGTASIDIMAGVDINPTGLNIFL